MSRSLTRPSLAVSVGDCGAFGGNKMKYLLIALLFLATPVYAFDQCMEGAWFDPNRDGEGIVFEVIDGTTFGFFYTYGMGLSQQWYTFDGVGPVMSLRQTRVQSFDPLSVINDEVGSIVLTAIDVNTLHFVFSKTADFANNSIFCFNGFCEFEYTYTRLTGECE